MIDKPDRQFFLQKKGTSIIKFSINRDINILISKIELEYICTSQHRSLAKKRFTSITHLNLYTQIEKSEESLDPPFLFFYIIRVPTSLVT